MTFLTWLNSTRYTVFIKLTDYVWCNNVHLWWWLTKIIFKQKSSITQVRKAELSHPISDLNLQQGNFSLLIRKDLILFVSYQSVCIFGKTDMRENLVGFISLYNQWNTGSVPTVLTTHADNHPPTHHTTLSHTISNTHTRTHYQSGCCLFTIPADRQKDEGEFLIQCVCNQTWAKWKTNTGGWQSMMGWKS